MQKMRSKISEQVRKTARERKTIKENVVRVLGPTIVEDVEGVCW